MQSLSNPSPENSGMDNQSATQRSRGLWVQTVHEPGHSVADATFILHIQGPRDLSRSNDCLICTLAIQSLRCPVESKPIPFNEPGHSVAKSALIADPASIAHRSLQRLVIRDLRGRCRKGGGGKIYNLSVINHLTSEPAHK